MNDKKYSKLIEVYKCNICGHMHIDPVKFRAVEGNVIIPGENILIGRHIFGGSDKDYMEKYMAHEICESEDGSLRVYGMLLCVPCFLKRCKIGSDENESGS